MPTLIDPSIESYHASSMPVGIIVSIQDQISRHLKYLDSTMVSNNEYIQERKKIEIGINWIAKGLSEVNDGGTILRAIEDKYAPNDKATKDLLEKRRAASASRTSLQASKSVHEIRYVQAMEWVRNDVTNSLDVIAKLPLASKQNPILSQTRQALIKNLQGVVAELGNYVQFMAALQGNGKL